MRIILASYPTLMLNKGGPSYVLLEMEKELKNLRIDVQFFDYWNKNLKLEKDDIIHFFTASVGTYFFAKNIVEYGNKYVVTPIFYSSRNAETIKFYINLEKIYRIFFKRSYSDYFFTKDICDNAAFVLPNTNDEADILEKGLNINKNKIQVIYNGVEERFYHSTPDLWIKKYEIKDFVLFVGHIGSIRKNALNIIKALQKIDQPAVIITNVLNNDYSRQCLQEMKKIKNLTFIEWLSHDDPLLESAYAACKTFILPTKYETPGIAAMEAALAGANIVITPYGGTKDYFQNFVHYAEPNSIDSIIKNIELSLNKPKNNELKEHIYKNFLWEKIAHKTLEIYKKIL